MNKFIIGISIIGVIIWGCIARCFAADPLEIAIIKSNDITSYEEVLNGFKEEIAKQGFSVTYREFEKKSTLVQQIKEENPNLILALGTDALTQVSQNLTDIPIVFSALLSPPEPLINKANVTGSLLDIPVKQQLEKLLATAPDVKVIGVIYHPETTEKKVQEARRAAEEMGLVLESFPIQTIREIPMIKEMEIDALLVLPDPMVCSPSIIKHLLLKSFRSRIPVMGISPAYVKAGALLALACDYQDIGRQSGEIAARIFSGTPPAEVPVSRPRASRLFLNLSIAKQIRLSIPEIIRAEAYQVFGQ
ncbi:MAG: ABC transporter substrate-binding protein [Deltaproteobacteria bacterium]|nr:ABC transporter substrate-binding protein [Deltaproteobacteria bacterium]